MKKKLLILAALCLALTACGKNPDGGTVSDMNVNTNSEMWENAVEKKIDGRCVNGTDGMLVISGNAESQTAYIIVSDESGENLFRNMKEGDEVSLTCRVLENIIPKNAVIISGEVSESDEKILMRKQLADSLVTMFMLPDSVYEDEQFEITD